MGLIELLLLAVGLSMDAFAVSVCKGLAMGGVKPRHMLICGAWFGGFQALMPMIGYLLGAAFENVISAVASWIAFGLLVLIGGILGLNVFVVLLIGIAAGAAITLITGQVTALELMGNMGSGVSGMFETILVTLLVASLCGLIRAYGGFESILAFIRRVFRGKRGGQLGIGLLGGLMDIATANNTVAIVMAGPIAKEVAEEYGISSKRSASLLDMFSCIFQGILPYGAQMLVALSTCATLGYAVSAFDIIPPLFYPFLLCLSSLLFILFDKK